VNVLLVPAHPGFPGQIPQSRKTVVCVLCVLMLLVGQQEGRLTSKTVLVHSVHINTVVRRSCYNTASKARMRVCEFLRDVIAGRDWYDGKGLLNRNEICDIIKFLAVD